MDYQGICTLIAAVTASIIGIHNAFKVRKIDSVKESVDKLHLHVTDNHYRLIKAIADVKNTK